jgi:integrase/recombinase XerC
LAKGRSGRWEHIAKDKASLEKLIHAFEVRNRTLNRSLKTIAWYSNNLRLFERFLKAKGYSAELGRVGLPEVRDYIFYLQDKSRYEGHPLTPTKDEKLSPHTLRAHVETLKAFFSWLYEEGYAETNRLEKLKFPRVPRKYVDVLTAEDVRKVISYLDHNTALGARNVAIITTLLDTGIRVAELANLKLGDAHIEQGYLKVMGKGARERVVPIGVSAQRSLLRYLYYLRPEPSRSDVYSFFLTAEGRPLTVGCVQLVLKRAGRASGVSRLHAHLCRHTFATSYLMNGGDVFSLQQILGHSSLEMVRRYVTLASAQVTVQHRKSSPMDRMNTGSLRGQQNRPNSNKNKRAREGNPGHAFRCHEVRPPRW